MLFRSSDGWTASSSLRQRFDSFNKSVRSSIKLLWTKGPCTRYKTFQRIPESTGPFYATSATSLCAVWLSNPSAKYSALVSRHSVKPSTSSPSRLSLRRSIYPDPRRLLSQTTTLLRLDSFTFLPDAGPALPLSRPLWGKVYFWYLDRVYRGGFVDQLTKFDLEYDGLVIESRFSVATPD